MAVPPSGHTDDFGIFCERAAASMTNARQQSGLQVEPGADDLLSMSPIPWVSFTSYQYPMRSHPADSVPRSAWGKRIEDGGVLKVPVSVHGHHPLIDGLHMGRFYEALNDLLCNAEATLSRR